MRQRRLCPNIQPVPKWPTAPIDPDKPIDPKPIYWTQEQKEIAKTNIRQILNLLETNENE